MKKPEDYSTNDIWLIGRDEKGNALQITMRDGTRFKWDEEQHKFVDGSYGLAELPKDG